MSLHLTTRQALASMPPDKAQWLRSHCRQFNHDLSNAVSVAACYRGAASFDRWCRAVASRLRTDEKCQQHGAANRNNLKSLKFVDFDELLGDFEGLESLGFADPALILEAKRAMEAGWGKKPQKGSITAQQLAADLKKSARQARNILKKQKDIDGVQGDLWGGMPTDQGNFSAT